MDLQKTVLLLLSTGLTRNELAAALGCTTANISGYARGVHGSVRPSNRTVEGLRKLLKKRKLSAPTSD